MKRFLEYNVGKYNKVKVETRFNPSGYNTKKGVSIYFTAMEVGENFETYSPMDEINFRASVVEMGRKNNKTIEFISSYFASLSDAELMDIFIHRSKLWEHIEEVRSELNKK